MIRPDIRHSARKTGFGPTLKKQKGLNTAHINTFNARPAATVAKQSQISLATKKAGNILIPKLYRAQPLQEERSFLLFNNISTYMVYCT